MIAVGALLVSWMVAPIEAAIIQQFNPATDFALVNPNAPWSYGFRSIAADTSFTQLPTSTNHLHLLGVEAWHGGSITPSLVPWVSINRTGSPYRRGDTTWQPGQLVLHPGLEGAGEGYAVLRWTCPSAGTFSIDAMFAGIVSGISASTNVQVISSGTSIFSGDVWGGVQAATNAHAFSADVRLTTGATLDFVIGPNGSYLSDSTALDLTITPVPEPTTATLAVLGLLGLLMRRKR